MKQKTPLQVDITSVKTSSLDWSVRYRTQQCYKLTIKSHIRRWTGILPVSFIPARYYRYPEYLEYELINHMTRYLFFLFGRRKIYIDPLSVRTVLFRNRGACDSLIHIPSRVFRHFVETLQRLHWFKCQKKYTEALAGYILELYVYLTQSFKILCHRRLLNILKGLDGSDYF